MKENEAHVLALIFDSERGFSNHPNDPGGPTQDGVTLRTLSAWRGHPVSVDELKQLGQAEREAILSAQFLAPVDFVDLPAGLDYCVADTSVNSGPGRAGRLLQQALGFTGPQVDGVIGQHTLAAARAENSATLIEDYCRHRVEFMRTLKNWGTFKNGWVPRVQRVEEEGLQMAAGHVVDVRVRAALPVTASAQAAGPTKLIAIPSGKTALATVGTVGATAITLATQATGILQPYASVKIISSVLMGLAVLSAIGTTLVTLSRAHQGATT